MTYLTSYLDLTYFNRSTFLWSYGIGKLPSLLSSVLRSASKTSSSPVLFAGPFHKSGQRCRKFFYSARQPWNQFDEFHRLESCHRNSGENLTFFFFLLFFTIWFKTHQINLSFAPVSEKPNVQSHLISLQQELTELVEQLLITCLYIKGLMAAEIMLLFLLM